MRARRDALPNKLETVMEVIFLLQRRYTDALRSRVQP